MKRSILYIFNVAVFSCISATSINTYAQAVPPADNVPDNPAVTPVPIPYPGIHDLNSNGKFNYIRTIVPDQPVQSMTGSFYKRQSTDYFDGLGRPLQKVIRKGHAEGNDLVSVNVYDELGRETYQYLPYAAPTGGIYQFGYGPGAIKLRDSTQMRGFYEAAGVDEQPYSQVIYDNSPLNRVVKQMSPGKSWVGGPNGGRGVTYGYRTNSDQQYNQSSSAIYITKGNYPRFTIGSGNADIPQYAGNYGIGELFVTKITDEDGKVYEEVKDKSGKLIMKRTLFQNLSENNFPTNSPTDIFPTNYAYTHFIYDDKGQLRGVIPPAAMQPFMSTYGQTFGNPAVTTYTYSWPSPTQAQVDGLCYQYFYDHKGRLIEKKIPGKEVEYFAYDKKDRQVFYQDGNLRKTGKWAFTFYDALDRPTATGISSIGDAPYSLTDVQSLLNSSTTNGLAYYFNRFDLYHEYPASGSNIKVLTYTYYDNYNQGGLNLFSYDYTQFDGITGLANTVVSPPDHASVMTRGLPVGTRVRVMDPDDPTGDKWLATVNYYDDKGRTIQTQSQNLKEGLDISSNIYFFQGMLYKNIFNHQNPDAVKIPTPDASGNIDHLTAYRLINTFERNLSVSGGNELAWKHTQRINNSIDYELAFYSYDHLGRNVLKEFSSGRNYQNYNIRGFLTGIAFDSYSLDTVFNENLYYDNGFKSRLYNGNIAGITWCGTDRSQYRSYGYSYDNLNRLTHAQFMQKDGSAWTNTDYDYTVSELSYDLNGNIQHMSQMAPQIMSNSAPIVMDDLLYTYNGNSNRLMNVRDNGVIDASLPDFKDNANPGVSYIEEYDYDDNGNMTKDDNKYISSITYNYLNKPEVITVDGKGTVTYVYDATGNRLQKRIIDENNSNNNETWDYIGNFVYKNRELQYILNEEGRARPVAVDIENTTPKEYLTKFVYDYFVKDHLGNVRSTITSKPIDNQYRASYEMVAANIEELVFDNIANVREVKGGGTPDDTYAARLNGGEADHRVGTAIVLRTKPGDKFSFNVNAFYAGDYTQSDESGATALLASLVSTLMGGTTPSGIPLSESADGQILQSALGNSGLASALETLTNTNNNANAPNAHLNYLWFDDRLELDISHSGSFQVVQNVNGTGTWTNIGTGNIQNQTGGGSLPGGGIQVPGNGLLLVYIDNQSIGKDVWFDNLNVENYTSEVLEEDHYYPFGLCMNVTPNTTATTSQQFKYQGTSLERNFGLETYETFYRGLDPQLGKFKSIDPRSELEYSVSPFAAMNNNPIMYTDQLGDANTIYLVNLEGSGMTNDDMKQTANMINSAFKELGLNMTASVYEGKGPIDQSLLDLTDAVAIFGSPKDVADYAKKNMSTNLNAEVMNEYNPERTLNKSIGVASTSLKKSGEIFKSNQNEMSAFVVLHGAGHVASPGEWNSATNSMQSHFSDAALSWPAAMVMSTLTGGTFIDSDNGRLITMGKNPQINSVKDLQKKTLNGPYIKRMQQYFNAPKADADYSKKTMMIGLGFAPWFVKSLYND